MLRLRTSGQHTQLTYKQNINEQGDAIEYELGIEDRCTMRSILEAMGYYHVVTVEKQRRIALCNNLTYMLDLVTHVGHFLEIERVLDSSAEIDKTKLEIIKAAADLGLTDADIETRKYDRLTYMALKEIGNG